MPAPPRDVASQCADISCMCKKCRTEAPAKEGLQCTGEGDGTSEGNGSEIAVVEIGIAGGRRRTRVNRSRKSAGSEDSRVMHDTVPLQASRSNGRTCFPQAHPSTPEIWFEKYRRWCRSTQRRQSYVYFDKSMPWDLNFRPRYLRPQERPHSSLLEHKTQHPQHFPDPLEKCLHHLNIIHRQQRVRGHLVSV